MALTPTIAVFDSGIGGTTVLDELRALAPMADIVYLADHAFGPYGERTLDEVRARTEVIARFLLSAGVDVIVIACNSASAAALHHLRDVVDDVAFVGMEPAIKPAAEATATGVVGVLATGATFQGELFKSLVDAHGPAITVVPQACPGLAAAVEAGADTGELLDEFLAPVNAAGADVVVLGCTHYPLIADEIAKRLPSSAIIIDPSPAVARQTLVVARERATDLHGYGSTQFWTTSLAHTGREDRDWLSVDIPVTSSAAVRIETSTLSACTGDLTVMPVNAIVNAANTHLEHGGGIAQAISEAGGTTIDEESVDWVGEFGPLEPGIAALTSAGSMPASYVIHVAGPIHAPNQDNETLLASAVFAALGMAVEIEAETVAVPAISAGVYGYPSDEAATVISETAAEFLTDTESALRSVRLVGFDGAMSEHFAAALLSLTVER